MTFEESSHMLTCINIKVNIYEGEINLARFKICIKADEHKKNDLFDDEKVPACDIPRIFWHQTSKILLWESRVVVIVTGLYHAISSSNLIL